MNLIEPVAAEAQAEEVAATLATGTVEDEAVCTNVEEVTSRRTPN